MAAVVVPALLGPLLAPAGSAGAEEPVQEVISTVAPFNSEDPSLEELRKPGAVERLRAVQRGQGQAVLPRETVGPARSSLPRAVTESATPSGPGRDVSTAAVQLPEPARSMSRKQCEKSLGNKAFYVRSRFAVCSGRKFNQVWRKQGRPVGWSSYRVMTVGTVAKNSRTVTVTYHLTDFRSRGVHNAFGLGIHLRGKIDKSWPSGVNYKYGGARMPVSKGWGDSSFRHTIYAAPGQGYRTDDLVHAAYSAKVTMTPPPGWTIEIPNGGNVFMLPPRWDKASYLPNSAKGAASFAVTTALPYSKKAGAPEAAVAKHIEKAFKRPGQTQPPYSGKRLPGQDADEPLTRLYRDRARMKENYNKSRYNCKKYFGDNYTDGGKECDEFPFKSTYEGAAAARYDHRVHPKNFSVQALPKKDNGAAGNLLRDYYELNRVVDGPDDGFLVKITS
ncbi:hypothetical protein [Streptomyces sp. CC224B]|uniref:NucA/NucB deoxyribonuclease domain-containing protein n=1 Tax=Streptomyces sp. CC224B TaxID=3044571 RepID=UPI0024A882E3|nr:hypothetical protein [Streptomyces sp. CC224B]